jgi:hypothetical protein
MNARSGRMLLGISLVAFVSLGLPDGVLGVAWPSIRGAFHLPLSQLGVLLAAAMAGYLLALHEIAVRHAARGSSRPRRGEEPGMVDREGRTGLA